MQNYSLLETACCVWERERELHLRLRELAPRSSAVPLTLPNVAVSVPNKAKAVILPSEELVVMHQNVCDSRNLLPRWTYPSRLGEVVGR